MGGFGLIAPAASDAGPVADAFAGIPGVTLAYYDVAGSDAAAIRRSIDANRLVDPHDGAQVDGLSNWRFGWRGRSRWLRGGCVVTDVSVDFAATVRLPRLTTPVSAVVQAQWDRYLAALARHEAGHVRYAYDHRGDVATAIRVAGCTGKDDAANAVIARIDADQAAYDRNTRHGETQGAVLP